MPNTSRVAKWALVALPALILLGAGCASPSERIAEKMTEKALESASGGKVNVDLNSDGGVNIKGKDGSMAVGGGGSRPESAPADLPNIPAAKNFFWMGTSGNGIFSFEVGDKDYRAVCTAELELLAKAGWQKSDSYEMDIEKVMIRTLVKPDYSLTVTCGDNTEEGSTDYNISVALNKAKR